MIKQATEKIKKNQNLTHDETREVFNEIMSGRAETEDIKSFLASLSEKGESAEEVAAAAEVLREKALKVNAKAKDLVDTCGTGGAKIKDVNISTLVGIVLAACGVKVAKHGNRSFSGKCGSADILEELGVNINVCPEKVAELIDEVGFGFMFAPLFHPAMKAVSGARKELAGRSIFNIIGPLSNPAGARMQILGVYDESLTELMAESLKKLGSKKALVVHGTEGLDEISIKGKTKVSELSDSRIHTYFLTPQDFGVKEAELSEIAGGTKKENAMSAKSVLSGKKGPVRDMVLINTAAALKMSGKAGDLKKGMVIAAKAIDSGKALRVLEKITK